MDTHSLKQWALLNADGVVKDHPDKLLSITSKLLRFRWNGAPAVAVGSDADGKTRINIVLDGMSWFVAQPPAGGTLHLILGVPTPVDGAEPAFKEHRDAIGTLVSQLSDGPIIRLWLLAPNADPIEMETKPATFTSKKPEQWSAMLEKAAATPVAGLAAKLLRAVDHPSIALYPKLSSQAVAEPWQVRLDGLEVGRIGTTTATLRLNSKDLDRPGEPRHMWCTIVGKQPMLFNAESLAHVVTLIKQLIDEWTQHEHPSAVLGHGQAEHALEAHVLSGRLKLVTTSGDSLQLAVENQDGALRAAQFPTLWGDVTRPARYLDALLADKHGRPWAIELKDQKAGGGHGSYLRDGIAQAVLYRHYIRSTPALDGWFQSLGLDRRRCDAALAFPTPAAAATTTVAKHHDLAHRFGVEVIEFPRPGALIP